MMPWSMFTAAPHSSPSEEIAIQQMICRLPLVASLVLLLNVTLSVSAAAATADEGAWSITGSTTVRRDAFVTATLLTDGRVLVTGGCAARDDEGDGSEMVASAELYDPATGTWSATGSSGSG